MLPIGIPIVAEISAYGVGGSDISMPSSCCHRSGRLLERPPYVVRPFAGDQVGVQLRRVTGHVLERRCFVGQQHTLAERQYPQAFPARGDDQPGADPLGIDAIDVLEQPQPDHLRDVSGVAVGQPEAAGDGPHEPRIVVDQLAPGTLVPRRGLITRVAASDCAATLSIVPVRPTVRMDSPLGNTNL